MVNKHVKISSIIVFIVLIFVLVGCQKELKEEEKEHVEEKVVEVEEVEEIKYYAPLTGEEIDEVKNNRTVAVMVNNHPAARPQTGLVEADVVFEILAEGNITRLMALFQQNIPEVVGPVRSARPYYFNLADDYGAIYVYHGAAGFIEDMLRNGAADYLNGAYYDNDLKLFKRESFRKAPHNSYLLTDALYDEATEKNYDITQDHVPKTFVEREQDVEADVDKEQDLEAETDVEQETEVALSSFTPAKGAYFYYGNEAVKYVYDDVTERYHRFIDDEQTIDLESEEKVALANVFIIEAKHAVIDDAGRRDVDLNSGGQAILLQEGAYKKVQWERIEGHIVPVENGQVVPFERGKTWVNVIPTSDNMEDVTIINE